MAKSQQDYQIAIVGGGIAGVVLALMFERMSISYVLLEGRDTLGSDRGAGIGLQPNGLRILDQLGLVNDIEQATIPLGKWFSYDNKGTLLSAADTMSQYREKIGYPVTFIERPKLLPIMVRHLQHTESIVTSAHVASIEETDEYVTVTTTDGVSVIADIVVGADGVHSVVRDHIEAKSGQKLGPDDYLGVSFSTVYGMSKPTEGIVPGERFIVYREKETVIGFTGLDGIIFWFVFESLGTKYPLSQAPRYTEADAAALCEKVAHVQVTPDLKFGELFRNRVVAVKIPVEEGVAKTWHTNRAVIVGDAACKTTPAGGQGANQAIESCAVLVNKLVKAKKESERGSGAKSSLLSLSGPAIRKALAEYAQDREKAAAATLARSQMLCKALFCCPGPATDMVRDMLKLSDDDWLLRAFTALSAAPVLADVRLTDRGRLFKEAVEAARAEMERRQQAAVAVAGSEHK